MARRKNKNTEDQLIDLVEKKEQAQSFLEQNQLAVIGGFALLILLIGGFLAYKFLYKAPKEKQAMEQMFKAEYQFKRDSFALALDNPGGGFEGFLDIIDNYSGTNAANLSKYYAGISYLNLGKYDAAIEFLNGFSAKGEITPITKNGALGDAYSELNELDKALGFYKKAASYDNSALAPYYLKKVALLQEHLGNNDDAMSAFAKIVEMYPESTEAELAKKYVGR